MPEKITDLTAFSPAKVNLHLAVKERRPDGYHNLESIFLSVGFGDTLNFSLLKSSKNEISMASEKKSIFIPFKDNIIYKAVMLFKEKTGFSHSFKINVKKRIPIGGGLGGGSSNAACTLLSLNKMTGNPLNRSELLKMAASLGSDAPFFIFQTAAAYVTGRGENIKPVSLPLVFLVLVNPGFSSNTARAFKLFDDYIKNASCLNNDAQRTHSSALISGIDLQEIHNNYELFSNDFLPVFPQQEKSIYDNIIYKLKESGADYANLSGAGSTCFGVYKNEEHAKNAAESLRGNNKWIVEFCKTFDNFTL